MLVVLDFRTNLDQGVSTSKSYREYTPVLFSPLFLFSPKNLEVGTLWWGWQYKRNKGKQQPWKHGNRDNIKHFKEHEDSESKNTQKIS